MIHDGSYVGEEEPKNCTALVPDLVRTVRPKRLEEKEGNANEVDTG